jgi:hypothetical protein
MGAQRRIPLVGDDDGGRFFHPYGCREEFCRATLCTAGLALGRIEFQDEGAWEEQALWWLQESRPQGAGSRRAVSRRFEQTGTVILANEEYWILFDAGPFGPFQSGHSHSDTLSLVLRQGGEDVLVDAGTYTYLGDREARDWFRGGSAHNTIRVDGQDQADAVGPFAWRQPPAARLVHASDEEALGECAYRGVRHTRTIRLAGNRVTVSDKVEGSGEHLIELFWHPGVAIEAMSARCYRLGSATRLTLSEAAAVEPSRRSRVYGRQEPSEAIVFRGRATLPFVIESVFEADRG